MEDSINQSLNHEDGIFGLPFTENSAQLVIIPVPWDATASYGKGASMGPVSILKESPQIDLYDYHFKDTYTHGIYMLKLPTEVELLNAETKKLCNSVVDLLQQRGTSENSHLIKPILDQVNFNSNKLNQWIYTTSLKLIEQDKIVACLGGEHSSPFGLIKAITQKKSNLSILQIDAHADLRVAYQGFEHSHASIMNQAMNLTPKPKNLVQVGIRDFCEEEYLRMKSDSRITTFFDSDVKSRMLSGCSWDEVCQEITEHLENDVYISFDIDGLSPDLCPQTGTPVPGGLSFEQVVHLLKTISQRNKKIIGFDLCEVAQKDSSNVWDSNVGARVLYQLCGWSLLHNEF